MLHKVEQRLAGLLLTRSERLGDDTLRFSQTDLAEFLGMQRTTINSGAQELKRAGAGTTNAAGSTSSTARR